MSFLPFSILLSEHDFYVSKIFTFLSNILYFNNDLLLCTYNYILNNSIINQVLCSCQKIISILKNDQLVLCVSDESKYTLGRSSITFGEFQDLSAWVEMSRAFSELWFAE